MTRNRESRLGCGYLAYAAIAGAALGIVADFALNARVTTESLISYGATGAIGGFVGGAILAALSER